MTASPKDLPPTQRRLGWAAFALLAIATFLFRFGGAHPDLGDTIPTRLLPASVLRDHDLDLDELPGVDRDDPPYFLKASGGHVYSRFPPGGALLLVPVYAAAELVGVPVLSDEGARLALARALAAFACASAVTMLFVALAGNGSTARALAVALLMGFGTSVWPVAAQDVWQHTFGLPLVVWCIVLLERAWRHPGTRLGWIGVPLGLLVLVRTPNALLAASLAIAVLIHDRRAFAWMVLAGVPSAVLLLAYNLAIFHDPFGAYAEAAARISPLRWLPEGLVGLLASPSHGLAIFSPVALVALLGLGRALDPATFALRTCYALAFAALVVVHAASGAYAPGYPNIATWHGGWTWGPRYLIEGMPLLAVLSWYGWPRMTRSRLGRPLAAVAAAAAIAINGAGFYLGWTSWFGTPDVDFCPGRLWSWRDNPTAALVWGLDPANECRPLHVGESRLDGTRTVFTFHEPAEWELLRRGWFKRNWPWEAHANGAEAEIEIPSSARGRLRAVVLELRPAYVPAAGQWVRVSVSGERGPRVRLSPSGTRIEVPIESGAGSHDGRDGRPWSVVLEFSAWTPRTWREILREHRLGSEWDVRQDAAILDRLELVQDPP